MMNAFLKKGGESEGGHSDAAHDLAGPNIKMSIIIITDMEMPLHLPVFVFIKREIC